MGKEDFAIFCAVESRSDTISFRNLTSPKTLFVHHVSFSCQIILKFCMRKYLQGYGSWNDTIAKQNGHDKPMWVIHYYLNESYTQYDDVTPNFEN